MKPVQLFAAALQEDGRGEGDAAHVKVMLQS